jgi:CDP-diacylglycerol--glycerol-3-phosphate 3-phosphatidyltransferase
MNMKGQVKVTSPSPTFTDRLRIWFRWFLEPTARFLLRLGLTPSTMTIAGLAGNVLAAFLVAQGKISLGGLLMLIFTPFDALDGAMARQAGEDGEWGAFVDSVTDRYSELFVLGGITYYFAMHGEPFWAVATFAAAAGTVLVSYIKARAEAVGYEAKVGLLTRVERYLVLAPSLLLNVPHVGISILALFANYTALQRIFHVRRQAQAAMKSKSR